MTPAPLADADHRSPLPRLSRDGERNVLWLEGEHDKATVAALTEALRTIAALDDADIVVDLSEVSFLDAATLGTFIRARNSLQEQSRTLTLRAPSKATRRVLDICRLADLVDQDVGEPVPRDRL